MSAILKNFVTVRQTRGDLLNPAEYRSIVEAIQGILDKYDFESLSNNYKKLLKHIQYYNDPHEDRNINFFPEIIQRIYAIYVNMLEEPLPFDQFQVRIANELELIELMRRILLNRFIYNQVKRSDGSVPTTAQVYLTDDWDYNRYKNPITLTFVPNIKNETDFIKSGWQGNTSPIPVLLSAENLSFIKPYLPLVFETTAQAQFFTEFDSVTYPFPLNLASNDLTLNLSVIGSPQSQTILCSLRTSQNTLRILMNPNKSVGIALNNNIILTTAPGSNGQIQLIITNQGVLKLDTTVNGTTTRSQTTTIFGLNSPITLGTVETNFHDLMTSSFGILSLVIYRGYSDIFSADDPNTFLIDVDSSFLLDPDQFYIVDNPS